MLKISNEGVGEQLSGYIARDQHGFKSRQDLGRGPPCDGAKNNLSMHILSMVTQRAGGGVAVSWVHISPSKQILFRVTQRVFIKINSKMRIINSGDRTKTASSDPVTH